MHFGGLVGTHEYEGDLGALSGLFALAEPLQLGAKTTFGFGCIDTRLH